MHGFENISAGNRHHIKKKRNGRSKVISIETVITNIFFEFLDIPGLTIVNMFID